MNLLEFLKEIKSLNLALSPDAQLFLDEALEKGEDSVLTEKGKLILQTMQNNKEKYLNIFTSKQISELVFVINPRSVSGAMKKLISEGFVEKVGVNPVCYGLTDVGTAFVFDK